MAMPTLEITADDIACSHGASVSDLDENSMFYLAARGLSRPVRLLSLSSRPGALLTVSFAVFQEARQLLLKSFVLDMCGEARLVRCFQSLLLLA